MARSIDVKWFKQDMAGAPVLNGLAGTLINVLDACLLNGFNTKAIQSFVIAAGVGVITFPSSGHGFILHQVTGVIGAADDQYNGDWRVTEVNATTIKVDATGVANATVAGTLSCKAAPVSSWVKSYSSTNRAAYKTTLAGASGRFLRVDDTVGKYANIRGYEAMTAINTGTGLFPTTGQKSTYVWWKSVVADASAKNWLVIADKSFLYIIVNVDFHNNLIDNPNYNCCNYFGDINSYKSGDSFNAAILACDSNTESYLANIGYGATITMQDQSFYSGYICRSYTQAGSAVPIKNLGFFGSGNASNIGFLQNATNAADGGLYLTDANLIAESGAYRGKYPGFFHVLNSRPLVHASIIENAIGLGGHVMLIGLAAYYSLDSEKVYGAIAVDISGGWR